MTTLGPRPSHPCFCCWDGTVNDARIPYIVRATFDGKLRKVFINDLMVRQCNKCGSISIDNRGDEQISLALDQAERQSLNPPPKEPKP